MKTVTKSKWIFAEWVRRTYGEDATFVKKGAIDFIMPDGTRVIVKRPVNKFIYFTRRQWNELDDDDRVAVVVDEGVLCLVPFRDVKSSMKVEVDNRRFIIKVGEDEVVLRIKCSRETYARFKKISATLGGDDVALKALLDAFEPYSRPPRPTAL
jgi:hypothetical protein